MAFNIHEVIAEVATKGVLRNNKFHVQFPLPAGLRNNQVTGLAQFNATQRVLEFWCEECNLPGAALASSDIRRYGYGVAEKKPFLPAFTDVAMTLRCDAQGLMHSYFHNWMRIAVCYQAGSQGVLMSGHPIGPVNNQFLWEVAYKPDYAVPVTITVFDDAGHAPLVITLTEAFPVFVGDIPLNWASRGEYARLPISMTFFDWSASTHIAVGSQNSTTTPNSPPVVTTV